MGKDGCILDKRNDNAITKGFSIACGDNDELLQMIIDSDGALVCDSGSLEDTGEQYKTDESYTFYVKRYRWTPEADDTKKVDFGRADKDGVFVGIPKIEVTHKVNGGTPTSLPTTEVAPVSAPAYYDLSGRQIENPASGLYIRVAGRDVEKVILN